MIRNVWSVLCRDIITDQETNSVSYVRCIEEGTASSLPVRIGPVFLGTLWEKTEQEDQEVSFRVILEEPNEIARSLLETKPITLNRPRHRLHFRLNALNVTEFGTYTIVVEFNPDHEWQEANRLPVLIREVSEKRGGSR